MDFFNSFNEIQEFNIKLMIGFAEDINKRSLGPKEKSSFMMFFKMAEIGEYEEALKLFFERGLNHLFIDKDSYYVLYENPDGAYIMLFVGCTLNESGNNLSRSVSELQQWLMGDLNKDFYMEALLDSNASGLGYSKKKEALMEKLSSHRH